MTDDKTMIGVAADLFSSFEAAMSTGLFLQEMDLAKFAISLAIRKGETGQSWEKIQSKWHAGSFDKDGLLRRVIHVFYPDCEDVYRKAEHLMQAGLEIIRDAETPSGIPDIMALVVGCNEPDG